MSKDIKRPSGWGYSTPRQAALDFITRYYGLAQMQKERALIPVPLLPFGDDEDRYELEELPEEAL